MSDGDAMTEGWVCLKRMAATLGCGHLPAKGLTSGQKHQSVVKDLRRSWPAMPGAAYRDSRLIPDHSRQLHCNLT